MTTKRFIRFSLPLLLVGLFALWLMPGAPNAAAADDHWRARYFNNRDLSGNPVWERNESEIDHDWGGGSPNPGVVNDDNFSVRWTRTVNFSGGNYRFFATMDDGMRVWIDDVLIIDNWRDSQQHTVTADRHLNGGDHHIRVEYYEAGGMAVAKFRWQPIGGTAPGVFPAWRGEYFNNMNLSGNPVMVRNDNDVNFNWGGGSPGGGVPADRFSVRWTRTLHFNPDTYRFEVFSDDGVRLWVNDRLVIDEWRDQSEGRFAANVALSGATTIRLEYFENQGRAAVSLAWNPPGGSPLPGGGGGTGGPITGVWQGEYFNNRHLSGSPVVTRNDAAINFNWGGGSPAAGIPNDNFSARWTQVPIFAAGNYRFDVFSDDGVRLWINDQLVINEWREQSDGRFSTTQFLNGAVPIRLEFFEGGGRAAVALSWVNLTGGTAPPTSGATATVISTLRLNIRNAPSVGGALLGQLQPGQTVGLTGFRSADSGWVEIHRPGGGTGWVSARWVDTSVPVSSLAVR